MNADVKVLKPLPKGTTQEQWDRYYEDIKIHDEYCQKTKPIEPNKEIYRQNILGVATEYFMTDLYNEAIDRYKKALSEWEIMRFCDRPNKPGYYRANDD